MQSTNSTESSQLHSESPHKPPLRSPSNSLNEGVLENAMETKSQEQMSTIRYLAIFALAATFTGSQITSFFTGPALEFIASDLSIGNERSWIPVAHSLATACTAPCAGYIQDMMGRSASLTCGMVLMCIGIIVSATSNGFEQSLAGSVIAGIASAIQELTSIAVVAELVTARRRGMFLALNTAFTICFTPAVLYAQLLSAHATWRWLYWIALIWNLLTFVALGLTYYRMDISRLSQPCKNFTYKSIDYVGIVLLIVGITLFLVAIQAGGVTHPWDSAYVLVQLLMGVFLLVLLIIWESKEYVTPLIPFRMFHGQRVVGLALLVGIFCSTNYSMVLNLGPEIMVAVFKLEQVGYGLIALGPSLALAVGATGLNLLLTVFNGHGRELLAIAAVVMTAFTASQAVISPSSPAIFSVLASFAGLGIGATIIPITTIITLACPQDLIATAVALNVASRTIGGSIGYVIFYNAFIQRTGVFLGTEMAPRLVEAGLPANRTASFIETYVSAVVKNTPYPPADPKILDAARTGFQYAAAEGARLVFYVTIPFGVLAIALSLALPSLKRYMTNQVLIRHSSNRV